MVDARIPYILVVKKFRFFQLFLKFMCHFKSSTCSMYMPKFLSLILDISFINDMKRVDKRIEKVKRGENICFNFISFTFS